eukprot:SAG31_NODE_6095_length_2172_cov_2.071394_2_plen_66_part_00
MQLADDGLLHHTVHRAGSVQMRVSQLETTQNDIHERITIMIHSRHRLRDSLLRSILSFKCLARSF